MGTSPSRTGNAIGAMKTDSNGQPLKLIDKTVLFFFKVQIHNPNTGLRSFLILKSLNA